MSRRKGKVGEREWAAFLSAGGAPARRGVQYQGGHDSPDVVSEALAGLHFEVKRTETLRHYDAIAQAAADAAPGTVPVVAHRRNGRGWLVLMRAEDWLGMALMAEAGARLAAEKAKEATA